MSKSQQAGRHLSTFAYIVGIMALILSGLANAQTLPATRPAGAGRGPVFPPINPALPTFWIIGDSTVRNGQDKGENGQWGWGNPISAYFDTTKINVSNHALGGTSSRTYQNDGQWDIVLSQMKPGDFLIMQFGHNDGGDPADPSRARATLPGNGEETKEIDNPLTKKHETVHTYGWYIRKYITDAKAKGAADIYVCSLIPRNRWTNGQMAEDKTYAVWAADAAKQAGAQFIPLNAMIVKKYNAAGESKVTDTYFPVGETTHTDWAGAILNAQTVVEGLKALDHSDLVKYLLPNPPADADIKLPSGKAR